MTQQVKFKEIAVAVLKRDDTVCVSLRQSHQTFGGAWEFPGGKVEVGETVVEALNRELSEEIGVRSNHWEPLIVVPWQYEHVSVRLNVFVAEQFEGEPKGREGQQVKWVKLDSLSAAAFPEANRGILSALKLPAEYMISGAFDSPEQGLNRLESALSKGIRLCQLRAKGMIPEEFLPLAKQAVDVARKANALILLNGAPDLLKDIPNADGIQLASNALFNYRERPIPENKWLGASTHNIEEIEQALKIGADFILLSPVKETRSHPGVPGIGWANFEAYVADIPVPVFALGGMKPEDVKRARVRGGQGVAAISGFWPSDGSVT
ncbi:MAG: Nudix family hydrolase [Gammaproteobacteria bacterium]|nr:Nudix family hydrolase [Gammaproteobacteria bacterium]